MQNRTLRSYGIVLLVFSLLVGIGGLVLFGAEMPAVVRNLSESKTTRMGEDAARTLVIAVTVMGLAGMMLVVSIVLLIAGRARRATPSMRSAPVYSPDTTSHDQLAYAPTAYGMPAYSSQRPAPAAAPVSTPPPPPTPLPPPPPAGCRVCGLASDGGRTCRVCGAVNT